jgi:hypothetical protein
MHSQILTEQLDKQAVNVRKYQIASKSVNQSVSRREVVACHNPSAGLLPLQAKCFS